MVKPFFQGLLDGLEQYPGLRAGMAYSDREDEALYDHGVNAAQALRALLKRYLKEK